MSDVTQMLHAIEAGDRLASDRLFEAVYAELRHMAAGQMAKEKPGQTLEPTALVHEAWIRLTKSPGVEKQASRRYFFAAAAEAMRRILIEQARGKHARKRGGQRQRIDLDSGLVAVDAPEQFEEIHQALEALSTLDARKAELVRMRYFLGLSLPEIAEVLAISQATAERDWSFSRVWLYTQLQNTEENLPPDEGVS